MYGLSDHYPTCFTHKFNRGKHLKHHHDATVFRNFKKLSNKEFFNDLHTIPWSVLDASSDVEDKLTIWNTLFMNLINEHIPHVTRRVKNKQLPG